MTIYTVVTIAPSDAKMPDGGRGTFRTESTSTAVGQPVRRSRRVVLVRARQRPNDSCICGLSDLSRTFSAFRSIESSISNVSKPIERSFEYAYPL